MSTTTEKKSVADRTIEYVHGNGKLGQFAALKAAKLFGFHADRQKKMIEAEDNAAAKAMGWEMSQAEEGEDVETNVLGDQTTTTNITHEAAKGLGTVAAMMLGGSVPLAAIAGAAAWHLLGPKPDGRTFEDETVEIGIGKIEDYFPQGTP
jgi:hypothetical protein